MSKNGVTPLTRGKGGLTDTSVLEQQIDRLACQLYNLTVAEIKVIKGAT